MAIFDYVAQSLDGEASSGRVEADDRKSLFAALPDAGYWIRKIELIEPRGDAEQQIANRTLRDLYHAGRMTYDDVMASGFHLKELEVMLLNRADD